MIDIMNREARQLVAVVAAVSGETFNTILYGGRRRPLPFCRYIVARELYNRNYSSMEVGRQLGMDHVTMLYGIRQLDTMKDANYARELDIQQLFNYVIENLEIEP